METISMLARLYRAEDDAYCASGPAELWVQPPVGDRPGRWGGRVRLVDISEALRLQDFAFRLELEDGRQAQAFADVRLDERLAIIDGNGPPPGE